MAQDSNKLIYCMAKQAWDEYVSSNAYISDVSFIMWLKDQLIEDNKKYPYSNIRGVKTNAETGRWQCPVCTNWLPPDVDTCTTTPLCVSRD